MIDHLKKAVQKLLAAQRHRQYERRVAGQALSYAGWLEKELERERAEILAWERVRKESGGERLSVSVLSAETFLMCVSDGELRGGQGDIWLVTSDEAALTETAALETERYFLEHPACGIAYGDEDCYLKPGWSPDLLQSFFYFGNVFAVRRTLIEGIGGLSERSKQGILALPEGAEQGILAPPEGAEQRNFYSAERVEQAYAADLTEEALSKKKQIYHIVLCCMDKEKAAGHIEKILFQGRGFGDWGREPVFEEIKSGHLYTDVKVPERGNEQDLVSVIIPTKDHPAMLSKCIHSLRERTAYENVEIIVIDNGSNEKNKNRILQMQTQLREEYSFRYLYRPMAFNFSALCNLGAGEAKGKYLLFLNDDIEVSEENWLGVMVAKAAKDYVGVVGAKLLYPDSGQIQHLGITNIHLGPAHKLQHTSDEREYYHGYNRCAVNVSAVTGACLLVRRKVFEEAGGFSEKLQVAFNDVEFCFRLLRAGYRNVCCNNTFLYHHESVSRGQDADAARIERLHRERDLLYALYPEMWNRDAYYSAKLVRDILDRGFEAANRFEEKRLSEKRMPMRLAGKPDPAWHNESLRMGLEFTGDRSAWETGISGGGDYYIQGWAYAINIDNSRYERSLLLRPLKTWGEEKETWWKVPYEGCYRPDFAENLPTVERGALCGISVWIPREALPEGKYLIGTLWEDTCSRQKLYRFSEEQLTAGERSEAGKEPQTVERRGSVDGV